MQDILNGLGEALRLIATGDAELFEIIALSLRVSGFALIISVIIGVPLGTLLGLVRVPGRGAITVGLVHRHGAAAGGGGAVRLPDALA